MSIHCGSSRRSSPYSWPSTRSASAPSHPAPHWRTSREGTPRWRQVLHLFQSHGSVAVHPAVRGDVQRLRGDNDGGHHGGPATASFGDHLSPVRFSDGT